MCLRLLAAAGAVVAAAACGGDGPPGGTEAVCREGLRFAFSTEGSGIGLAVLDDDTLATPRLFIPGTGHVGYEADWAPDGQTIGLAGGSEVGVVDTGCEPFEGRRVDGTFVARSPDGRQLLLSQTVEADGRLWLEHGVVAFDPAGDAEPALLSSFDVAAVGSSGHSVEAAWSPDSRHVAIALATDEEMAEDLPGHLYVVPAGTVSPEPSEIGEVGRGPAFAWSSDGGAIAFRDHEANAFVVDTSALDQVIPLDPVCAFDGTQPAFVWAPDGSGFLYPGSLPEGGGCALREVRLDDDEFLVTTRTLPDSGSAVRPAWFRDSRHVVHASADGRTLLWADPPELAATPLATVEGEDAIIGFAFAPTHDHIAVLLGAIAGPAELLLADTPGGAPAPATPVAMVEGSFGEMAWSPDGERLAVLGSAGAYVALPDQVSELDALEVTWSPDSRYLTIGEGAGIVIYRTDGDAPVADRMLQDARDPVWAPLAP